MKVYLGAVRGQPHVNDPVDAFRRLAAADTVGRHHLADDPEDADVLLYPQCHMLGSADWQLAAIRDDPVARRFPEKVTVYDERDRPWRAFPGIYVSMPQGRFDIYRQRAWSYYTVPDVTPQDLNPDLLFSFVGSDTARCRRPLFELHHPDAIVEEARGFVFWDPESVDFAARRARYQATTQRSRFVLCPRGHGTSSIRLYETLAAGRVPVIISDDWVPPVGPDWSTMSIRWPEGCVDGLVETLQAFDNRWDEMSKAARMAYEMYFAREVAFDRIAELCDQLRRTRLRSAASPSVWRDAEYARAAAQVANARARTAVRPLVAMARKSLAR